MWISSRVLSLGEIPAGYSQIPTDGRQYRTAARGKTGGHRIEHIKAETLWPSWCRRQFPMYYILNGIFYFIHILLKCVSVGPIDNKIPLVWIMNWRRICEKPVSKKWVVHMTKNKHRETSRARYSTYDRRCACPGQLHGSWWKTHASRVSIKKSRPVPMSPAENEQWHRTT